MKILSVAFIECISDDEITAAHFSDRIWLPPRMFERWILEEDPGIVTIAELEGIGVCIYGPHTGPADVVYVPQWICDALKVSGTPDTDENENEDGDGDGNEDDYIVPIRLRTDICQSVKIQPKTSAHIRLAESTGQPAEDILSRGFERYTCLKQGQTLELLLENNEVMMVDVLEATPASDKPLCIRSGEILLELLPPLDMIPDDIQTAPPVQPLQEPTSTLFQGEGYRLSDTSTSTADSTAAAAPESREERRRKMAEAAMKRYTS